MRSTLEPPALSVGPRCDHGVPLRLLCRECADPLTVGQGDPRRESRRFSGRVWPTCDLLLVAIVIAASVAAYLGRNGA